MKIRAMEPGDLPVVLDLNQSELASVGDIDLDRLAWIFELADHALVADEDGQIAGFVITLATGTAYDSANYRWFEDRYDDFRYLDRIVVSAQFRRRGVASLLYDAIEDKRPVALEVNSIPPNIPSLTFHRNRGYEAVGELPQSTGKTCTMFLLR
ncbi:GNAT family N-acetyltransferase [soil metagenome]